MASIHVYLFIIGCCLLQNFDCRPQEAVKIPEWDDHTTTEKDSETLPLAIEKINEKDMTQNENNRETETERNDEEQKPTPIPFRIKLIRVFCMSPKNKSKTNEPEENNKNAHDGQNFAKHSTPGANSEIKEKEITQTENKRTTEPEMKKDVSFLVNVFCAPPKIEDVNYPNEDTDENAPDGQKSDDKLPISG